MKDNFEVKTQRKPSYLDFDISRYPWKPDINYKEHPEAYMVGKGEQGVLICEPYKSIIGPFWRFKDPDIAEKSAVKIYDLFLSYISQDDFVGADLSRKYLQMGYTRARRYANYKGGKKYDQSKDYELLERGTGDAKKAEAASIFYDYWKKAEGNQVYKEKKIWWKKTYG
ncbi:DUF4385 domain-containing protein [Pedobacter mucosus]|uniref:DUF4385 domain-containing protein n=1 Tax=Pedobacter mucosus TaxID=2895286 RepID=UPI001EE3BF4D|nr:DUF4385 domain-containing protein [Pedobacter mucosus]UKT65228.1 DUF4385 domain-containing protein [Pedobacter mucosus]